MHSISFIDLAAIGTIIAAIITGSMAYLNLVISKEQKISDFRQKWIDELREEISQFIASVNSIIFIDETHSKNRDVGDYDLEWMKEVKESHHNASSAMNKIQLRINPKDSHKAQVEFLKQLEKVRHTLNTEKYRETLPLMSDLRDLAKDVLKMEWKRVKRGEPTFRVSKWIALAFLAIGIGYGVTAISRSKKYDDSENAKASNDKSSPPHNSINVTGSESIRINEVKENDSIDNATQSK